MSAEAPRNSGAGEPIYPQGREGSFHRFLRKLFGVPLKSQLTSTIIQPSQGLEKTATNLSIEVAGVKDTPLEPVLPEPEKPFDLTSEVAIFIRTEGPRIKEKEIKRKREIDEAQARESHREPPILTGNERGKQIADQSNIRELITQAQAGLLQYYPAVKIGEVWSQYSSRRNFDTVSDQMVAGYYSERIFPLNVNQWQIEDFRKRWKKDIINHEAPDPSWNVQQSYYIRLGWREGIRDLNLSESDYYFIEVKCNPWWIESVGGDTLTIYSKQEQRLFKKDEWSDKEKLKKAVLQAIQNPNFEGYETGYSETGYSGPSTPSFTSDGEHTRTTPGPIRI